MRSQPTLNLENSEAVLPGLIPDNTQYIFCEFLDLRERYRFALTCRSGIRFFANNLKISLVADLRKALVKNGFQVNWREINLHELSIDHLLLFLNILKYNYTLNSEKRAFCETLTEPHIQAIMSLTFWRVAIFCDFLVRDIQINKLGIQHSFVTEENLSLFKELVKFPRSHCLINAELFERLMKLNAVEAQSLLSEALRNNFNRKTYHSRLRLNDLGFLEEKIESYPVETEILATFEMQLAFSLELLGHLGFLYLVDRRTAKWLSGILRTTTLEDREIYRGFFHTYSISSVNTDYVARAGIAMQYFSDISSDEFTLSAAESHADVSDPLYPTISTIRNNADVRAKLLLLFLIVEEFAKKSASALNVLCSRFVSPLFRAYVADRIAHIGDTNGLENIIVNSFNLLSDTYWKPADWEKLTRSQLQIIQFVAEKEFAMRNQAVRGHRGPRFDAAFWSTLETTMESRMEKLSFAIRPDSQLWHFPANFLTDTLPTFSRRVTPQDAEFLDPDLLVNLSKKRSEPLPAPMQGLGKR